MIDRIIEAIPNMKDVSGAHTPANDGVVITKDIGVKCRKIHYYYRSVIGMLDY